MKNQAQILERLKQNKPILTTKWLKLCDSTAEATSWFDISTVDLVATGFCRQNNVNPTDIVTVMIECLLYSSTCTLQFHALNHQDSESFSNDHTLKNKQRDWTTIMYTETITNFASRDQQIRFILSKSDCTHAFYKPDGYYFGVGVIGIPKLSNPQNVTFESFKKWFKQLNCCIGLHTFGSNDGFEDIETIFLSFGRFGDDGRSWCKLGYKTGLNVGTLFDEYEEEDVVPGGGTGMLGSFVTNVNNNNNDNNKDKEENRLKQREFRFQENDRIDICVYTSGDEKTGNMIGGDENEDKADGENDGDDEGEKHCYMSFVKDSRVLVGANVNDDDIKGKLDGLPWKNGRFKLNCQKYDYYAAFTSRRCVCKNRMGFVYGTEVVANDYQHILLQTSQYKD